MPTVVGSVLRGWRNMCYEYMPVGCCLEKADSYNGTVVYISSPFSADTDWEVRENVERAMKVAIELMQSGYVPLYTHGNYYLDLIAKKEGVDIPYDTWIENCVELLCRCDAMLYLGYSKGCNKELMRAIEEGIPVYFSVEEFLAAQRAGCTTIS